MNTSDSNPHGRWFPYWLSVAVGASVINIPLTLISQPVTILLICIVGWLTYNLLYSKKTNWNRKYLLLSSMLMGTIIYLSLLSICYLSSSWICSRNIIIPSIFPSLIPFWGWLLTFIVSFLEKRVNDAKGQ